jgi:hypothetical protein
MGRHMKAKHQKQHEYIILFLYHKRNDPVTWKHYGLMKHFNPKVPIIPIIDGGVNELPGTVDVKDFPSKWYTDNLYFYPDTLLYRWFENRQISAKRYVMIEYDAYCELSFPEFLKDVWDKPVACHKYFTYEWWPDWYWFQYDMSNWNIPEYLQGDLAAISPFGFILFQHDALATIVANAIPYRMFCETRIATACRKMDIPVSIMKNAENTIGYRECDLIKAPYPAIYHPVKLMDFNPNQLIGIHQTSN